MHFTITTFACQTMKITAIAVGLAAWLAGSQSALAGVSVTKQGSTLFIVGDSYDNYVGLVGGKETPYGEVGVRTNPNSDTFVPYEGIGHIDINLQGGDNLLQMDRIRILGDLTIAAGDGDNVVQLGGFGYGDSAVMGNVSVYTGGGRDFVSIEDSSVYGVVDIDTAGGSDFVDLAYGLVVILGEEAPERTTGSDAIRTTDGSDGRTEDDEGPNDLKGSGEAADLPPPPMSNSFGALFLFTGEGRDIVGIMRTEVQSGTTIDLDSDDDRLTLAFRSEFYGDFDARGGQGQDWLYDDPLNYYESNPHFQSFELP